MSKKRSRLSPADRYLKIHADLEAELPQVYAWLVAEEDYEELRLKRRDDGVILAIAKGYDEAGGPVVCFGQGYGVVGALMALEGSMASNSWRVDKPFKSS